MSPKKKIKLTPLEMEVMEPLWEMGEATIRQIHKNLPSEKRPEFTTLQTIIFRLEEKGVLARGKKEGHGFLFKPLVSQKSAIGNLVDDFNKPVRGYTASIDGSSNRDPKNDLEGVQESGSDGE